MKLFFVGMAGLIGGTNGHDAHRLARKEVLVEAVTELAALLIPKADLRWRNMVPF